MAPATVTIDRAPYPGPLREGDRGTAVVVAQSGLEQWAFYRETKHSDLSGKLRRYKPTGDWAHPTSIQTGYFQELHSIPVSNSYGPHVHTAMARWFTPHDCAMLQELEHNKRVRIYHDTLYSWCNDTADHRPDWTYTQGAWRMQLWIPEHLDPDTARYVHGDCSATAGAFIKLAAIKAGLPTPDFGDWWTTWNLINLGLRVSSTAHLQIGDRIHYGANSHVGLYAGRGRVQVWSFGGEPGPASRAVDYRPIYGIRRDIW